MTTEVKAASKASEQAKQKTAKRRTARHERKKQAYLQAALDILVQDGFERLTIARLASRMKVSVGAIYRYFSGKEAVLVSLQEIALKDFLRFLQGRLSADQHRLKSLETPPENERLALIMAAFTAYGDHGDVSPSMHRLIDVLLSSPKQILSDAQAKDIVEVNLSPIFEIFGTLIAEAVASGCLEEGDVMQRTRLAWALAHGLDHQRKLDRVVPNAGKSEALVSKGRRALLRAYGANPEAIEAAEAALVASFKLRAGA